MVLFDSTGVAVQLVTSQDKQKSTVICQGANDQVGRGEVEHAIALMPEAGPSGGKLRAIS